MVFPVEDVSLSDPSGCPMPIPNEWPPLVAKLAFATRAMDVAREAWFYNELESLQGSVIPRCYGLFRATLGANESISLSGYTPRWTGEENSYEYPDSSYPAEWRFMSEDELADALQNRAHPLLQHLIKARNEVVVLLLERLEPLDDALFETAELPFVCVATSPRLIS